MWWQLSRAEKATARLLDFRFHNWHQKQITIACTWLELCDEEQAAARRLGFDAAQWDAHAPESIIVPVLSLAQLLSAQQFLAAQLKQTRAAAQQLRQVCMHPFNASREQPTRLESTACEANSPYFAAWCGSRYDVHQPALSPEYSALGMYALPPFVRPLQSRRSAQNPNGYCREHCCMYRTPINVDSGSGMWKNKCCDCTIGAPG